MIDFTFLHLTMRLGSNPNESSLFVYFLPNFCAFLALFRKADFSASFALKKEHIISLPKKAKLSDERSQAIA